MKSGHKNKRVVQSIRDNDQQEKAIIFLLWGRKGCKEYKDLTHAAFSIEKLVEFLRTKKGTENQR